MKYTAQQYPEELTGGGFWNLLIAKVNSSATSKLLCCSFAIFLVSFGGVGGSVESTKLDTVTVQLCGDPDSYENAWPNDELLTYEESAFAFSRIPQAYTDKGFRDEWPNPLRVVAEAEVELPEGKHQILLRSRRAARLWLDGRLIAENPFPPKITDGHDPVEHPFIPLGKGVRFPGPGDQEKLIDIETSGRSHLFRLEFFVGGFAGKSPMRPETGETLVAVSLEGKEGFKIVSPNRTIPLTDAGWETFVLSQNQRLDAFDSERRRTFRASQNEYWDKRHKWALEFVENGNGASSDTVDSFIYDRIHAVNAAIDSSDEARHFIENVRPVLEERCWSCHSGEKVKGELRLDSRGAAMTGGGSGIPALVPGNADESYLLELILEDFEEDRMPPKGDPISAGQVANITDWITSGAAWPKTTVTKTIHATEPTEDWQFLRRVYLDTVGVLPTETEVQAFLDDKATDKRSRVIDQLLEDVRWADHWVSYWQDVLAENPTIVNPTLNNTGPFRYWIHEALQDNLPMDRFVTELVLMEGSLLGGGSAGFEMASQNDVPMAAKANIVSTAFLATQMKCSRCHDAPFHDNEQEDLFSIAALLAQEPLTVPKSSSVPMDKLHTGGRKPLIEVTLPPGSEVTPKWPFESELKDEGLKEWLINPGNTRELLALHITGPSNQRFPKVVVNRLWQRLFGQGIIEPVDDWENADPLFPELLEYLARELVVSGYDLKSVARLILNSEAYQRQVSDDKTSIQYFASRAPRQMSAEQVVDSLFTATGKTLKTEPLTVDIGGGRPWSNAMSLGKPSRAWMFGGLANNRGRPSLILPRAQAVVDVLTAFGWRASRQEPTSYRQRPLSPLQPAILNNGIMASWLVRLSDDHEFTKMSLEATSVDSLIDNIFLRILSRYPSKDERAAAKTMVEPGFDDRIVPKDKWIFPEPPAEPELFVTWGNHLSPNATPVALEAAEKAKAGALPTSKLQAEWRERMEDLIWSLINLPETVYYP